jgi:hypothetical protein
MRSQYICNKMYCCFIIINEDFNNFGVLHGINIVDGKPNNFPVNKWHRMVPIEQTF